MNKVVSSPANKTSRLAIGIIIPLIIILTFIVISLFFFLHLMNQYSIRINDIGKIRGGIQRYVKIRVMGHEDIELLNTIKSQIKDCYNFEQKNKLLFTDHDLSTIINLNASLDNIYNLLEVNQLEEAFRISEIAWSLADEIVNN